MTKPAALAPMTPLLPRRLKGTGTIRKGRDGKFRALYAFVAGKREEIDGSPFDTYEAAHRALAALLVSLQQSGATNQGLPLRKLAERALDAREAAGYRSFQTDRERWSAYLEDHELANVPAVLITRGEIRVFLNGLRAVKTGQPLATSTKKNVRNLLSAIFDYAIEHELVDENPAKGLKVKASGRVTEEMRPLSLAQAERLLEEAADLVVKLAIGTGMRSGELRALRWEHVHLDDPKPHILCCYGKPPNKPRKNGRVHRVQLFGLGLDAMRAIAKRTPKDARTGVVFRSKRGCYRAHGHVVERKDWVKWLAAAGIDRNVRFHDLRHTCATLLLNGDLLGRKWSYEEVKELLDHSSVKVTERYAKALGTLADKAAAEMRAAAKRPRKAAPDRGATGAQLDDAIVAQALEILGRRGSDSNRRMTVLQSRVEANDSAALADVALLARSYVKAVAERAPLVHVRGLDLAQAVLEVVERAGEPTLRAEGDR